MIITAKGGNYSDPHCYSGRSVIAQLFEWKWSDVAAECETFLSQHHFCAVQISPPHENRVVHQPNRPWWERYQPVSYRLETRSGNEADFIDMIRRCNAVNVRIYVDMTINNMADTRSYGLGTGFSPYHGEQRTYPKVPYSGWDFHDKSECFTQDLEVHNYSDPAEVRSCQHDHLADLDLSKPWVQEKIIEAMNHLIDIGIAGFYINNAKYNSPEELSTIYSNLNQLNNTYFAVGTKPFIYHQFQEIDGEAVTSSEYTGLGKVASYKYGPQISAVFRHAHTLNTVTNQIPSWALVPSSDTVVFIDDQYTQRDPSHSVLSMQQNTREYSMAVAFTLANPYGFPRIISSYRWNSNIVNGSDIGADAGPPSQDPRSCTGNWESVYYETLKLEILLTYYYKKRGGDLQQDPAGASTGKHQNTRCKNTKDEYSTRRKRDTRHVNIKHKRLHINRRDQWVTGADFGRPSARK
ncbi:hypothetical protein FSP39_008567 [Pinctada imbricata]|uniref:alpha-amylase n=1 Tax=Pinctada imbricata TaxID=66713 RepID=A0AA88XLH5_PINIB|nr:hypothetical protein FSP39_008567 [Pinctada imbricata]